MQRKIILMHDQNSQKSFGKLDVEVKNDELKKFFQKGCAKSFIPKNDNSTTELVTLNTAGGLTSGDNFVTNFKLNNSLESRCLAKVVLPLPEGAHKIITFPNIKEYLMIVLLIFQVKFSFQLHWIEYLNY